jgi:hypothetical protein
VLGQSSYSQTSLSAGAPSEKRLDLGDAQSVRARSRPPTPLTSGSRRAAGL